MTVWEPILSGGPAEQAFDAAEAIAADIAYPMVNTWKLFGEREAPHSLGFGGAGIALFFWYFSNVFQNSEHARTAFHFLSDALVAANQEWMAPGLIRGISGVYWACEHINRHLGFVRLETKNEDQNFKFANWCEKASTAAALTDGIGGLCLYAAEGMPDKAAESLMHIVAASIERMSELVPPGIAWKASEQAEVDIQSVVPGFRLNRKAFPLNVGYGLAGIVGSLLSSYSNGVAQERTKQLVENAISCLLSQKRPPGPWQLFPAGIGIDLPAMPSGWYVGDLGIAIVLFNASRVLGRDDWRATALEIAQSEAEKRERYARINSEDYTLSTGAAGHAHLFNRLFHATGEELFADAARFWYGQALACRRPGTGTGGFLFHGLDFQGFLSGASGLGLALLGAISSVAPGWDRALVSSHSYAVDHRSERSHPTSNSISELK